MGSLEGWVQVSDLIGAQARLVGTYCWLEAGVCMHCNPWLAGYTRLRCMIEPGSPEKQKRQVQLLHIVLHDLLTIRLCKAACVQLAACIQVMYRHACSC